MIPMHEISPPVLNSASPWASDYTQLRTLYLSPHTGAITTRTSLIDGYPDTPRVHQVAFFDAASLAARASPDPNARASSVNSYGFSPHALSTYLAFIKDLLREARALGMPAKPIIVSIAASTDVGQAYAAVCAAHAELGAPPFAVEINLSCPNIAHAPPPAYGRESLRRVLVEIVRMVVGQAVPVGLKLPPYTHAGQFDMLKEELLRVGSRKGRCPVSFLTTSNTLGGCAVWEEGASLVPSETGLGLGGVGGATLHPLALGNVRLLRRMLDVESSSLQGIMIIGVGGVSDAPSLQRMVAVGADAVGVATALGCEGVGVFARLAGVESCADAGAC